MSTEPLDRVRTHLTRLRLFRALAVLPTIVKQAERREITLLDALATLLGEEAVARESRRFKTAITMSHLPAVKTVDDFDFTFAPSVDRAQLKALEGLGFLYRKENVLFLGPPGVGKTHLAIGIGVAACRAGFSTHFTVLSELVTSLLDAQRRGLLEARLQFYAKYPLLIIDEVGYSVLPPGGPDLLFQLVNTRYERGSLILTSNMPLREWRKVLGNNGAAEALVDRLLHHAVVISIRGSSYRLRERVADLRSEAAPAATTSPRRRSQAPKALQTERR